MIQFQLGEVTSLVNVTLQGIIFGLFSRIDKQYALTCFSRSSSCPALSWSSVRVSSTTRCISHRTVLPTDLATEYETSSISFRDVI